MTQRYLPYRTLSFAERLEIAGLNPDTFQPMSYRKQQTDSLIRKYVKEMLEDAEMNNQGQNYENVDECINELGTKSPTRKKNNLD